MTCKCCKEGRRSGGMKSTNRNEWTGLTIELNFKGDFVMLLPTSITRDIYLLIVRIRFTTNS